MSLFTIYGKKDIRAEIEVEYISTSMCEMSYEDEYAGCPEFTSLKFRNVEEMTSVESRRL